MPVSKEQIEKIAQYQKTNNEQILIKPRKEDRISERIQILIDAKKTSSKQAYIIQAVKTNLNWMAFRLTLMLNRRGLCSGKTSAALCK